MEKAIEFCSADKVVHCEDCPFYAKCLNDENLFKYALDLINRKDAEIESLKAEVERLKSLNSRLEAENYSFKVKERENPVEMALLIDEQAEQLKTAKAETYKECIEKVKEELKNIAKIDWQGGYYYLVGEAFFDNLLNEFIGE